MPRRDVIVIGGGVAGLSAATALAADGLHVTVFEARPSAGGRCSTFTDPATGERVDNGQHVMFGCYDETFQFLRRIDATARVRVQSSLALRIIDDAGDSSVLRCPRWPAPAHLFGGLLQWKALGWRDRVAALRLLPALRRRDAQTVRDWLVAAGQTDRLIALLWEPLAIAALNQSIETAAAEPFREVVRRMFSTDPHDSTLVLPAVPLHDLFVIPSISFLEHRHQELVTGSPARVTVADEGRVTVRVRDAEVNAAAVIAAVPWYSLPDVLPDVASLRSVREAARSTRASPIVTVNLWLDRDIVEDEFVGLPGRCMQWIFDKGRLLREGAAHLSLVSSGAEAIAGRSNEEIIDLAWNEVREALPAAHDARITRAVVVREKRATFSLAPGQPPRPATATSVRGVFLAGDWIDTGLPATIESAVMSGHRAAAAVRDFLTKGT